MAHGGSSTRFAGSFALCVRALLPTILLLVFTIRAGSIECSIERPDRTSHRTFCAAQVPLVSFSSLVLILLSFKIVNGPSFTAMVASSVPPAGSYTGIYSYGLYSYGLCSYGLYIPLYHQQALTQAYIVMACIVPAYPSYGLYSPSVQQTQTSLECK